MKDFIESLKAEYSQKKFDPQHPSNVFKKFGQKMISATQEEHANLTSYINDETNIDDLIFFQFIALFASRVSPETLSNYKQLFNNERLKSEKDTMKVHMGNTMTALNFYVVFKHNGLIKDKSIDELFEYIFSLMIYNLRNSFISNKPQSTIDFKNAMIQRFFGDESIDRQQKYCHKEAIGFFSSSSKDYFICNNRASLFVIVTEYLYHFDHQQGLNILSDKEFFQNGSVSIIDEIEFVKDVYANTPGLEKHDGLVRSILTTARRTISDKIDGKEFDASFDDVLSFISETAKYASEKKVTADPYLHRSHVLLLYSALQKYIDLFYDDKKITEIRSAANEFFTREKEERKTNGYMPVKLKAQTV